MDKIKLLGQFRDYLTSSRYSPKTIESYTIDTSQFLNFLSIYKSSTDFEVIFRELDLQALHGWLSARHNAGLTLRSTKRSISSLKKFAAFIHENYNIDFSPHLGKLRTARLQVTLPRPVSFDDILQTLEKIRLEAHPRWVIARNLALIMLFYGSGLRISEALGVKKSDIIGNEFIKVLGKGSKERMVPLLPSVTACLNEYLALCPFKLNNIEPIFFGVRGNKLSPRIMQLQIAKIRRLLNLPETYTPHALRHSFASHLIGRCNIFDIQNLMGHVNASTTELYTKIDYTNLLEHYTKAHPLNKKRES